MLDPNALRCAGLLENVCSRRVSNGCTLTQVRGLTNMYVELLVLSLDSTMPVCTLVINSKTVSHYYPICSYFIQTIPPRSKNKRLLENVENLRWYGCFRGDLTDVSAELQSMVLNSCWHCAPSRANMGFRLVKYFSKLIYFFLVYVDPINIYILILKIYNFRGYLTDILS